MYFNKTCVQEVTILWELGAFSTLLRSEYCSRSHESFILIFLIYSSIVMGNKHVLCLLQVNFMFSGNSRKCTNRLDTYVCIQFVLAVNAIKNLREL